MRCRASGYCAVRLFKQLDKTVVGQFESSSADESLRSTTDWSATPAAIAGVILQRLVDAAEVVVHEVERDGVRAGSRPSCEKALVSRVKRRIDIRMVRFWRST